MHAFRTILLFLLLLAGYSAYLFFTPNNFISSINSFLNTSLPNPLGNYWAVVYGSLPALISITVTIGVSQDVMEGRHG